MPCRRTGVRISLCRHALSSARRSLNIRSCVFRARAPRQERTEQFRRGADGMYPVVLARQDHQDNGCYGTDEYARGNEEFGWP
jgi:hypothetical protein